MPEKKKILIIEDDKVIATGIKDFLEIEGFEAVIEHNGSKGQELALSGSFALILLDLMLPGKDGLSICRVIREKIDIPILMVTGKTEDSDKIKGLGFGANDYIVKPFSATELVARVKSHITQYERLTQKQSKQQTSNSPIGEIDYGWLRINNTAHRVYINEVEVTLNPKEYELLYFLASNPEVVFTKETLYDRIWGEDMYGDIKTVKVHISRLRDKIEKNPANPLHIETVWGAGYRLLK
ncbi:MAG: response regulator transcription factor [Tannerella sp.]|jgi:DNA-binding response OmpR family regulator|nr:response regulator transcription factor [Tannerella sp.]